MMNARINEATVFIIKIVIQGMILTILEYAEASGGTTVGIAMPTSVTQLQTVMENVKRNHLEKNIHQTLTAMSIHLFQ